MIKCLGCSDPPIWGLEILLTHIARGWKLGGISALWWECLHFLSQKLTFPHIKVILEQRALAPQKVWQSITQLKLWPLPAESAKGSEIPSPTPKKQGQKEGNTQLTAPPPERGALENSKFWSTGFASIVYLRSEKWLPCTFYWLWTVACENWLKKWPCFSQDCQWDIIYE